MGEGPAEEEREDALVTETLEYLARSLVAHPDRVEVEVVPGEGRTIFRLIVDPEDLGRIIGKGGRMARALRQVTRAAATKAGIHAYLEIAG